MKFAAAISLLIATATATAAQLPFFERPVVKLAPESSSTHITSDGFTTLTHPEIEASVRIKRNDGWCDSKNVRSYSGYVDTRSRSLFFFFFEARNNPDKAPLLTWDNGGPGASSALGMLFELGPCSARSDGNSTVINEFSWNNDANMIFIEQPAGVGYSYAREGVSVSTSEEAAKDIHALLTLFIENFPEFKGRPVYLSGESYGGAYLPSFAVEIMYQNSMLAHKNSSRTPINLQGVAIGNGLTDVVEMVPSYYTQSCTTASGLGRPVLDIKTCTMMQPELTRCHKMAQKACRDTYSQPECKIALTYCAEILELPFTAAGVNPYDISKRCTAESLAEDLCYPESRPNNKLLNQPWLREQLGVSPQVGEFQSISWSVNQAFAKTWDIVTPRQYYLNALLERGVRVLIYVGTYDWICNFHGNWRMVSELDWTGQAKFLESPRKEWSLPNSKEAAGEVQSHGDLTYLTLYGAGHMVPTDKPREALHMINSWLKKSSV